MKSISIGPEFCYCP